MSDNEEIIIAYGKKMILQAVIVFIMVTLVGFILRMPLKIIIFLACLMPLRQNAGGVHMASRIGCAIGSFIVLVVSALIIKYIDIHYGIQMLVMCFSSMCIAKIAPVDNVNNPLEEDERILIAERMIYILATECIAFLVLYLLKLYQYSKLIVLATFVTCMLVLTGELINMTKRKKL